MHYTPFDIDLVGGIGPVMKQIENHLSIDTNKNPVYVSFDIDGVCSSHVEGTGTRVRYGLTPREIIFILQYLRMTDCLVHLDLVEVNPLLELSRIQSSDFNFQKMNMHGDHPSINTDSETLYNACEFILRAFGKNYI
jgi:arginase family enzyme